MQLFYSNPNRSFYVREITRKIGEQINSVRRELSNLLSIGIIVSDTNNNRLYYEVNQKYEFFKPLSAIFGGKIKMASDDKASSVSKEPFKALGRVEIAIYTGQFTRDESSGIDFLLVGDINPNALQKFVTELEAKESKEIRYTVMDLDDFIYRRQIKDRFIDNILKSKTQVLIDETGLIPQK